MAIPDHVMTLTKSKSSYSSFDVPEEEKYDAGNINVVFLLSQKFLQKNIFRKKTAIFRVFALWSPNRSPKVNYEGMLAKER